MENQKEDLKVALEVLKNLFKRIQDQRSAPSSFALDRIGFTINKLEILDEYPSMDEFINDFEIHGDYIEDLFPGKKFHPRTSNKVNKKI